MYIDLQLNNHPLKDPKYLKIGLKIFRIPKTFLTLNSLENSLLGPFKSSGVSKGPEKKSFGNSSISSHQ